MATEQKKPFWKSKTLWFSVLTVIAGVSTWAAGQVEAGLPLTLIGLMNAVLRAVTKTQIK